MIRITALFLFLFPLVSQSQSQTLYQNAGYQIHYPAHWTIDTSRSTTSDIFFLSPLQNKYDRFSENIGILTQDLSGMNMDMETYRKISEEQIKGEAINGNLIRSDIEKKNGQDQYTLEYTMTINSIEMHLVSICYIRDETAYLATFTCLSGTWDRFQKDGLESLRSFRLR